MTELGVVGFLAGVISVTESTVKSSHTSSGDGPVCHVVADSSRWSDEHCPNCIQEGDGHRRCLGVQHADIRSPIKGIKAHNSKAQTKDKAE